MAVEQEHTPGPWSLLDKGYTFIVSGGTGYITRDVCRMDASTMAAFEQKANARLMAAAPDMLAMLKHAVHWHDQISAADVARYQAAIAKAEGK